MQETVCVGARLGRASEAKSGKGTYVINGYIFASIVGIKSVESPSRPEELPTISVTRLKDLSVVPEIGSVVTARVTRITPRVANLQILCVGPITVRESFSALLRFQDVRATQVDKVEMYKCFRPGDIVRAEVISLGDSRSYYTSTAKPELGVIHAKSVAGLPMTPVSRDEMQCPKTKSIESRKVAKVS